MTANKVTPGRLASEDPQKLPTPTPLWNRLLRLETVTPKSSEEVMLHNIRSQLLAGTQFGLGALMLAAGASRSVLMVLKQVHIIRGLTTASHAKRNNVS
jgi:hypothetical protein